MQIVIVDKQTFNDDTCFNPIKKFSTEFVTYATTSPAQVVDRCKTAEVIISNKVVFDHAIMQQLPNLKLICIAATGTNNVDLSAAKKLGIAVTNVSGYARQSVVQYVFSQLLSLFSQTEHHNNNTKQGLWQQSPTFCYLGNGYEEVADKTLGIIGYGSLGKAVEQVALALGMKVLIADRKDSKIIRSGRTAFDEVLSQADILSLHCPHTPETENLINEQTLTLMKPSAVLINTARGAVVDEFALLAALQTKKIQYAILDVLQQEPPTPEHHLLNPQPNNLIVTAHIAWASNEAQQRLVNGISENVAAFIANQQINRVEI